ncbi:uncharacterized protein PG986_006812 [Apiospora aurea]|uniref:Uncharacterized protein n=1 Tax=Apiospora aurea TaxID=335848 RepID=A0ABR1QAU1_9PEZI
MTDLIYRRSSSSGRGRRGHLGDDDGLHFDRRRSEAHGQLRLSRLSDLRVAVGYGQGAPRSRGGDGGRAHAMASAGAEEGLIT